MACAAFAAVAAAPPAAAPTASAPVVELLPVFPSAACAETNLAMAKTARNLVEEDIMIVFRIVRDIQKKVIVVRRSNDQARGECKRRPTSSKEC